MMTFQNTRIDIRENFVYLSAEPLIQYRDSRDESIRIVPPSSWTRLLYSNLHGKDYVCYLTYGICLPRGMCNRITDYKKVWGLLHLPKGDFDGDYNVGSNRVYFGVVKQTLQTYLDNPFQRTAIISPSGLTVQYQDVFNCFANCQYMFHNSFEEATTRDLFSKISRCIEPVFCVYYHGSLEKTHLLICGTGADSLFSKGDS